MNANLIIIMFELRCMKDKRSSIDEEIISKMGVIAEEVETYKLKRKLTEAVKTGFGLHFKECILIKQPWRDYKECYCAPVKTSEETFITLFKSLDWKENEEDVRNRLLDRIYGESDYPISGLDELMQYQTTRNYTENTPLL